MIGGPTVRSSQFRNKCSDAIQVKNLPVERAAGAHLFTELPDGGGAVALRELAFVGCEDERHVPKLRGRVPEGLVHEHLPQRVREMLLSAKHMRDFHEGVVHRHTEVVHLHA